MPAWIELADYAGRAVLLTCGAGGVLFVVVFWVRLTLAAHRFAPMVLRLSLSAAQYQADYWLERLRAVREGRGEVEIFTPADDDMALALELLDDSIRVAGASSLTIPRWQRLNDGGALRRWSGTAWERATGLLDDHLIKTTGGGGRTVLRPEWRDLATFARDIRAGTARLSPLPYSPEPVGGWDGVPDAAGNAE